jgi:hypothetical protein
MYLQNFLHPNTIIVTPVFQINELVNEVGPPVMTTVKKNAKSDQVKGAGVNTTNPEGHYGKDSGCALMTAGTAPTHSTVAVTASSAHFLGPHLWLPNMATAILLLHFSGVFLLILLLISSWIQVGYFHALDPHAWRAALRS